MVDKRSLDVYFSDPSHRRWEEHYAPGWQYGGAFLWFTPAWAEQHLPPWDPEEYPLRVVLLDAEDGRLYEARQCAAYERDGCLTADWVGPDHAPTPCRTLQEHFFASHYCACHRKADARAAGARTDEACEGRRFLVERVESPGLPGLVLYSETASPEELEASLRPAGF